MFRHPLLLTDEAVEACADATAYPMDEARDMLAAFVAHHEGERPCERCEDGYVVHPPSAYDVRVGESRRLHERCADCGGTGKVRADRLVKLSEVVAALREATHPDGGDLATGRTFADYIEREFGAER